MSASIEVTHLGMLFKPRRSLGQFLSHSRPRPTATWALRDVSLQVTEGRVFGLLGPNGAGKTTLLKIISGLILPTQGSARVAGHDTVRDAGAVKRMMGFMSSDERSFYWRLTGRENLRFFGSLHQLHGKELGDRIAYLLDHLELEEHADKPVGEYSSG